MNPEKKLRHVDHSPNWTNKIKSANFPWKLNETVSKFEIFHFPALQTSELL